MSDLNYTPYHIHTMLSSGITNVDSVSTFKDYIELAKKYGMKAFAFSEHGSVLEWVHKKNVIEAAGMKYIHAEEFYLTERIDSDDPIRDNYHCVLIARNYHGVRELNKLSSIAFRRDGHFYYVPRISFDELEQTSDNIIVTSACLGGALASDDKQVVDRMLAFMSENKERCFLEVQHHNVQKQIEYNQWLFKQSKKYGIRLIAGTDAHAATVGAVLGRKILQQSKDISFSSEDGWDLVFKDYESLVTAYEKQGALTEKVYLEAINNTNVMADMVETFELDYSNKFPVLYDNSLDTLKSKIKKGISKRGIDKYPNYDEYKERIKYEVETFIHNNAVDFLLLEEDYKRAMKDKGVNFGYSRGSVSGSLVAYLLGITEVDALKYKLNFPRFMNIERVSQPDIDTDWFDTDRDKVREYLFNKQGLSCCNIITFNTIKMRGAIKDVGRALAYSPAETQELCNMVYEEDKKELIPDEIREKHKRLFDYVDMLRGTVTSLGRHAAGLVVSPYDVEEEFGTLYISSSDKPISQINMKEIDSLNYVKLDILGLDCVGLISQTCEMAGIPYLTPDNTDYNDMNVWNDIAKDTTMIFQFESGYASEYLKHILQPEIIERVKEKNPNFSYLDLMSMANGAIRPAGASYRDQLSNGIFKDNGNEELNNFLAPTLGYLVYQEQIIEFLHKFCGFTMGEADIVRRHFSKKTGTETDIPIIKNGGNLSEAHYIKGFIKTMQDDYNVSPKESEKIIESFLQVIEDASDYLFSYNHALPYSFIGFAVGYLRHYYPLETCTVALNIYQSDDEKLRAITKYTLGQGIKIAPIRFRYSKAEYSLDKENKTIYKGLASVKHMNAKASNALYELRHEKFESFTDFLKVNPCDARQTEILIKLNFFEEFGSIGKLLRVYEIYQMIGGKKIIKKDSPADLGRDIMAEFCTETEKQYRVIDSDRFLRYLESNVPDVHWPIRKLIEAQQEYLGYIDYVNPKMSNQVLVLGMNTKYTPKLTIYSLAKGNTLDVKIKKPLFNKYKIQEGMLLLIKKFERKPAYKKTESGFEIVPNKFDWWIRDLGVIL